MAKQDKASKTTDAPKDKPRPSRKWKYIAITVVCLGILLAALRQYVSGGVCHSKARLDGKFAIVTGANTGIGKETAKDLATRGARVLMACRDEMKCSAAADDIFKTTGQRPSFKILDLADLESVKEFAINISDSEAQLDILINNAGVMMCPKLLSKQGFELQFATNHLGHFLLTSFLLPLLYKSSPSRIVVVSSKAYENGVMDFDDINSNNDYGPRQAYRQSKLANILFANELARRLNGSGVTVNSLHPGVIDTDLIRHVQDMIPRPVQFLLTPLVAIVRWAALKTPEEGAQTTICCAVSEELERVTGKYFSDCVEKELMPHATNEDDALRLWTLSEKMVGLANELN